MQAGLARSPAVALLGPRQVGKTTLAREIVRGFEGPAMTLDLEDARDLARPDDPFLALAPLTGLVVLDEVQRRPDLFPTLRVLIDRPDGGARFLLLGSASPDLLRPGSESLAGSPTVTRSMRSAIETLRLDELTVIHAGSTSFAMRDGIRAVALDELLTRVEPLR